MKNHFLLTEDILWDYADGFLPEPEKAQVADYLRQYPEWQARYQAILDEKSALFNTVLEIPPTDFSKKVMAAWAAEQLQAHAHKAAAKKDWILLLIPFVFGLFILIPTVLLLFSGLQLAVPVDTSVVNTYTDSLPSQILNFINMPGVHYVVYLGITFALLRFVEKVRTYRLATHAQQR